MQIIELTKEDFDNFAFNHINHNFYQTSQYGSLMNKHGFFDLYVGLLDDNHNIIGASLILVEEKTGPLKYGYAPRGFLIDYKDTDLIMNFTKLLRSYLSRLGFVCVKIDPPIIHIERDNEGNIIHGGINNEGLITFLKRCGYEHTGFNLYFENLKPRWNAITKLDIQSEKVFNGFSKQMRNKIRKSYRKGVTIYKGTRDDLKLFYSFISKKHTRKLNYYLDYYEIFSKKDMFELFFAKINPTVFIKTSKRLYEKELEKNNELVELIKTSNNPNAKSNYVNKKINSDRLLAIFKKDVANATNLHRTYPNGVVIATSAVIKYNKEIFFLIDGYDPKFKSFSGNHLMKWAIINEFSKKGYLYAHHNAITGDFNKGSPYYGLFTFKKGFNSKVTEYIGEFDMIVNRQAYYTKRQLKAFKNLFNLK